LRPRQPIKADTEFGIPADKHMFSGSHYDKILTKPPQVFDPATHVYNLGLESELQFQAQSSGLRISLLDIIVS
jgi:hypothetical protein